MKRGNISRKVAASVMTGAMMVSMAGMSVCAAPIVGDGNHAIEAVPVQKTVATDGHTYAPDTSFSFRVANGGEGTFEGNVVSAGVTGGLAADENAVFTPSGTTPLASYTAHGSLAVDGSVFTSPGVYHYLVTEASGDYEGMDYDNSTYDVYLYVYNSNNGLYVGNAVSVKNGDKADLAFTNDYGAREDNDSTHDITVTKEVTGTMGNKASQEFQFAVSVDGGEGEWYQVLVKETADAAAVEYHVVSGAQATSYSIKHGGSIQVLGLSESDQYSIIEDDYSSTMEGVNNYCIAVKEKGDDIVFLRKIVKGGADKSYGIQVAKLAGVPDSVIARAKELVEELSQADISVKAKSIAEESQAKAKQKAKPKKYDEVDLEQISLFDAVKDDDVVKELQELDISNMTPMDAMNTLYRLQNKLKNRWQS